MKKHNMGWACLTVEKAFMAFLMVFFVSTLSFATSNMNSAPKNRQADVVDGVIVMKLKPASASLNKTQPSINASTLQQKATIHKVSSVKEVFPFIKKSRKNRADLLYDIFKVSYSSGKDPVDVAADYAADPNVEYAEPLYLSKIYAVPNDDRYNSMDQFPQVQAPEAWDIIKGQQGDVVIAIIDGGTDWQHEDLAANVWINSDEVPNNGRDDDGNGFSDDRHGWNFATDSFDPTGLDATPSNAEHGTHVAGTACAVTNNQTGVASISWNCRFMPINAGSATVDDAVSFGYDAIQYAVENGADIVSCSWGRGGSASRFEEDVVNYAYANNVLVVAAAGNDGFDPDLANSDLAPQFPANYDHVLTVGATDYDDIKSGFSNYGVSVDVFAPGQSILSTIPSDVKYGFISGTSMATPFVSGLAGLVKTLHPTWTVDEIREQIRVSCDPIDDKSPEFAGLLGMGRVNALKALTVNNKASVRIANVEFTESGADDVINLGDMVDLQITFTNYLISASNIQITLTTDDPVINIINANASISILNKNATQTVSFRFQAPSHVPDDYPLRFFTDITIGNSSSRDLFSLSMNPPRVLDHNTGTLATSITSQGNFGFVGFAGQTPGKGFEFNGTNYLFEGGILVGTGENTVSDCVRGDDGSTQDDDFTMAVGEDITLASPGELADQQGRLVLTDSLATNPLGLNIKQQSFTFSDAPNNDFIILSYLIRNVSSEQIENCYFGVFVDWDVNADASDYARYDLSRNMSIVQNRENNPNQIVATKILTPGMGTSFRAIHNPNEIYDGFNDFEKWQFLSNGIQTTEINGVDLSTLLSVGPFTLQSGHATEVAFAVIAGANLNDLQNNADAAQAKWDIAVPVELYSFSITEDQGLATLEWRTASESVNYGFEIERSTDGITFNQIGFVKGAGTEADSRSYSFIDDNSVSGTFYYRLKQLDTDGSFHYSDVVEITINQPNNYVLKQNYPNPFNMSTKFSYSLPEKAKVTLAIYNLRGEKVKTLVNREQEQGSYDMVWNGTNDVGHILASGIYLYKFQANDFSKVKRITLIK